MSDDLAIRLVVNADGFGADAAVDRAVLRAHHEGIVTSVSVLGSCPQPAAVKALLDGAPRLGVGAHLCLVGAPPAAPPGSVRSLVGPDGRLPPHAGEVV